MGDYFGVHSFFGPRGNRRRCATNDRALASGKPEFAKESRGSAGSNEQTLTLTHVVPAMLFMVTGRCSLLHESAQNIRKYIAARGEHSFGSESGRWYSESPSAGWTKRRQ